MERSDWTIYAIIAIISFFYIIMIIDLILSKRLIDFFWTCYIAIPLIIFGLIRKNPDLILSQMIILAINDLFWIFDFAGLIILGHPIIGINQIRYFPVQPLIVKLGNIQHLFVVPLSIVALSILKLKRNYKTLLFSLIEISLFFVLTLLIVPKTESINCVHQTCITIPLNFLPYPIIWFLFVFGFIIFGYFIITSLPFIRKRVKASSR